MKRKNISDTISNLDDGIIEETIGYKKANKKLWVKWAAAAACLVVVAATTFALVKLLDPFGTPDEVKADIALTPLANLERPYRGHWVEDVETSGDIIAPDFPWEELTFAEQYWELELDGKTYIKNGKEVDEKDIGTSLGQGTATGYDWAGEATCKEDFGVYTINNLSPDIYVALHRDGVYYLCRSKSTTPFETLGQFIEGYDLTNTLPLSRFYFSKDDVKNQYLIADDDYIWAVLGDSAAAPFVKGDSAAYADKNSLSFYATSEALGMYKLSFKIYENGYLCTNITDWLSTYNIGTDAAKKIFDYVTANGKPTSYEPYINSLYGTVTRVEEGYLLIDDSVLCTDPSDGMVFKLPLDKYLKRYVKALNIKVGDTVRVEFKGDIDVDNENTLMDAQTISYAKIKAGEAYVEE